MFKEWLLIYEKCTKIMSPGSKVVGTHLNCIIETLLMRPITIVFVKKKDQYFLFFAVKTNMSLIQSCYKLSFIALPWSNSTQTEVSGQKSHAWCIIFSLSAWSFYYSRTSMAQTGLRLWKIVLAKGSSSHPVRIMHEMTWWDYDKTCLKRPLKRSKIAFQDWLSRNEGQKYCRMLSWSILQYFRLSLSYHLSLRPMFC